ncbi:hypothetical protein [Xylocopilactobacillus apis]|uniref:DUF5590 domain-containing protein n=1 Tax=Xylocopilactobacillus apis TaxID=2932183 RepID=A0AAU9D419_9LACO|nr:hypothetical protein [Xylocopilactobacillus apis]BDR56170.1 hypothetical protein KIMC2_07320 [Xylocopilactobacillus apis]
MDQTNKKPFYKTWWFWIIILIIVIVGGYFSSTLISNKTANVKDSSTKTVKKVTPVTKKSKAKEVAETAIYNYLSKEKKQKIKKSDIQITAVKTSGPYYVKKNKKARTNGWEIQGKINNKTKGSSVDLISAVVNMPDQNKSQIDYLSVGWDTFVNNVKQTDAK